MHGNWKSSPSALAYSDRKEATQREIAKQLHISRSYVSRIEKRAFMKLYREFKKGEKAGKRSNR